MTATDAPEGPSSEAEYDPFAGPDLRFEVKAADIVAQLVEPDAGVRWRKKVRSTKHMWSGVYITGLLDLRGADLDVLLRFENCRFEKRPDVRESQLLGLTFARCWLPGVRARNLRCRNDVRLVDCVVEPESGPPGDSGTGLGSRKEPGVPDAAVVLTDAVVDGSVVLSRTEISYDGARALQADRLQVAGALLAYRLKAAGEVRLPGLRTGGNVSLSGAQLSNLTGFALDASGAHIGGSLLCKTDRGRIGGGEQRFRADGALFLPSIRIGGNFMLSGADIRVRQGGKMAVDAWQEAMRAADPSTDPWPALFADRMRVDGDLDCAHGFTANGTVRFLNAVIGGSFRLAHGSVKVRRGTRRFPHYDRALHIDGTEISGDFQARSLVTTGQLRLSDVTIGGNLLARYSTFRHFGRDAFSARRAKVAGNVQIAISTIEGTLQLQGMAVGGSIELFGTQLTKPALRSTRSYSVDLRAVGVGRDLVMSNDGRRTFLAAGGVNLDGAKVGRRISLEGAVLESIPPDDDPWEDDIGGPPDVDEGSDGADVETTTQLPALGREDSDDGLHPVRGIALNAGDVVADELVLMPARRPEGRVILSRARCATLDDNEELWQATDGLELEDFRYEALGNPVPLDDDAAIDKRIARLRAAMGGYRPGPYDELAAMLRASGNEEHAATVLQRKQQYRYDALAKGSGLLGPGVLVWSWLQRAVVGYGYRPTRALAWLFVLLVAGSLWFGLLPDACVADPELRAVGPRCVVNIDDTGIEWNPVLYTADLLVPIIDLGNKGRWHMGGVDKWVATGFIATGWILATTVAAGVTRSLRRQ